MNGALDLLLTIHAHLSADSNLNDLLGGSRIFDSVPPGTRPPYVLIGSVVTRDWSTGTETGGEHRIELIAYTPEKGRRPVLEIAAALIDALADLPSTAGGHAIVNFAPETVTAGFDTASGLYRSVIVFRAVAEPL